MVQYVKCDKYKKNKYKLIEKDVIKNENNTPKN